MSTVTFLGQEFDTAGLSEPVLNYINTYNAVVDIPTRRDASARDYQFRMTQALQRFGDKDVTEGIQLIINYEVNQQ